MFEKTILEEIHGTITNVYENGIVIQPDDPEKGKISEAFSKRDYYKYHVGQRVVHVAYSWTRPATIEDKRKYADRDEPCPEEVVDSDYVTYDELEYNKKLESEKTR